MRRNIKFSDAVSGVLLAASFWTKIRTSAFYVRVIFPKKILSSSSSKKNPLASTLPFHALFIFSNMLFSCCLEPLWSYFVLLALLCYETRCWYTLSMWNCGLCEHSVCIHVVRSSVLWIVVEILCSIQSCPSFVDFFFAFKIFKFCFFQKSSNFVVIFVLLNCFEKGF